ncbi:hypothetical protein [Streptomyces sp. NRRL S-350]|uniref:hypothetical protein n=1 Tax=Streptomyces sp. NRRL S-350 TaxID=1463902 RepID=UPI0004C1A1AC|nr:hypothetical protein [Streptomyces sp. NRRL S-350]
MAAPAGEAAQSARDALGVATPRCFVPVVVAPDGFAPGAVVRRSRLGRPGCFDSVGALFTAHSAGRDARPSLVGRVSAPAGRLDDERLDDGLDHGPLNDGRLGDGAVGGSADALGSMLPVDRAGGRAHAVSPGPCARAGGRVRFDRSGRLKTSHGSRLFDGEGPTEEDNAARAAGPPTG